MQLKETIVEGLRDGKASDVVCIDMRKVNGSICDYFIIAHGDSATHIDGINRSVYKRCVKRSKRKTLERGRKREITSGFLWITLT